MIFLKFCSESIKLIERLTRIALWKPSQANKLIWMVKILHKLYNLCNKRILCSCLFKYQSIYPFFFLSFSLSLPLYFCSLSLSLSLSECLFLYYASEWSFYIRWFLSISVLINQSINLSTKVSFHLSIYLSFNL